MKLLSFRTFSNSSIIVCAEGLFCPDFSSSSLTMVRPSSVSMFVYRLETSNVTRRQFLGSLPNAHNRLMISVVSRMYEGRCSASGLNLHPTNIFYIQIIPTGVQSDPIKEIC